MINQENTISMEILRLAQELPHEDPSSERYQRILNQMAELYRLEREYQPDPPQKMKFSGDAVLAAATSILTIIIITQHERLNVISSKALGFVTKLRL